MSKCLFKPCNILLPGVESYERWSVIACDQFTSEPQYWKRVRTEVGNDKSTLNLILPEVYLNSDNSKEILAIHDTMKDYLLEGFFSEIKDSFVYVERTLQNGEVRAGIVGVIDLEEYSYEVSTNTKIRPTEKTVIERIPPRKKVRKDAPLELPHIILFYDDKKDRFTSHIRKIKSKLKPIYDFDLIMGGGRVSGWLLNDKYAEMVVELFAEYQEEIEEQYLNQNTSPLVLAVGDGNHSLATAKSCWEDLKKTIPEEQWENHPSRFAMVELENIQDVSQKFEPIHRIVYNTNCEDLVASLQSTICCEDGFPIEWKSKGKSGVIHLNVHDNQLPLAVFQDALDKWLTTNAGEVDYIHGEHSLARLTEQDNAIGFLMPNIDKNYFFSNIVQSGVLPRKTFSIGHAQEKRYYLEARKIHN